MSMTAMTIVVTKNFYHFYLAFDNNFAIVACRSERHHIWEQQCGDKQYNQNRICGKVYDRLSERSTDKQTIWTTTICQSRQRPTNCKNTNNKKGEKNQSTSPLTLALGLCNSVQSAGVGSFNCYTTVSWTTVSNGIICIWGLLGFLQNFYSSHLWASAAAHSLHTSSLKTHNLCGHRQFIRLALTYLQKNPLVNYIITIVFALTDKQSLWFFGANVFSPFSTATGDGRAQAVHCRLPWDEIVVNFVCYYGCQRHRRSCRHTLCWSNHCMRSESSCCQHKYNNNSVYEC